MHLTQSFYTSARIYRPERTPRPVQVVRGPRRLAPHFANVPRRRSGQRPDGTRRARGHVFGVSAVAGGGNGCRPGAGQGTRCARRGCSQGVGREEGGGGTVMRAKVGCEGVRACVYQLFHRGGMPPATSRDA